MGGRRSTGVRAAVAGSRRPRSRWSTTLRTVVVVGIGVAGSVMLLAPQVASAASFSGVPPQRLYMTPAGVSLPNGIAEFVGVKVGTLEFDGSTDPISQDLRTITVQAEEGPIGCALVDEPVGQTDYNLDDCTRLYLDVSHGTLSMGTVDIGTFRDDPAGVDDPAEPVYIYPGGAVLDAFGGGDGDLNDPNDPAGFRHLEILGETADLSNTLADLVYTPDADYHYAGTSNQETLQLDLQSGDPAMSGLVSHAVEIRVLDVNAFPDLTGPAADKTAQPDVPLLIPPGVVPVTRPHTGAEYTVTDADNDEIVDGDQAAPPETEEPIPDGEGDKMLLIGYLDCGQPTTDLLTGFHFRGGTFVADQADIEDLLTDFYDLNNVPLAADAVSAVLDGLELLEPGITTLPLATNDPFGYHDIFAGIGEMDDVMYALSQLSFLHDAPNDTCTLLTIVSDLGNNGLPLQYLGSPPAGVEVPMVGFDFHSLTITTGDLTEIDVSFEDAAPIVVDEATAPIAATARIRISPAAHPAFTVRWDAVPVDATPGSDYAGTSNNSLIIEENVEFIPVDLLNILGSEDPVQTNVFPDSSPEPTETFNFEILPDAIAPPPGYVITSSTAVKPVSILDDETPDNTAPSVTVNQGGGQVDPTSVSPIVFDVVFSEPVVGFETGDVTLGGTAAATTAEVSGSGSIYAVSVSGMTQDGTVAASIGAGVATDAASNANVAATWTDNEVTFDFDESGAPTLSVADASVAEGTGAGTTAISFDVTTSAAQPVDCGFRVVLSHGSTVDADFTTSPALFDVTAVFDTNDVTLPRSFGVARDVFDEPDETFTLTLSPDPLHPVPCSIGDGVATGTITDDDLPLPTLSVADTPVVEGTGAGTTTIGLVVSTSALYPVECGFRAVLTHVTTDDADFTSTVFFDVTAVWDSDDQDIPRSFGITRDVFDESNETFTLTLSPDPLHPVPCSIGDGVATGTIVDDDGAPPDAIAPTVTIDQAAGQVDPTTVAPIVFDVDFSEPVTGFVTGDVTLQGTAGATTATVVPAGDGVNFTVEVTAMTQNGTVQASIAPGAAEDAAANPSAASSSTDNVVTFAGFADPAPTVTVEQGAAQADPTALSPVVFTATFSEPVTGFATGEVTVSGTAGATTATVVPLTATTYTIEVSGMTQDGTVLATIAGGMVIDATSNPNAPSTSADNQVTFDFPEGDVADPTVTVEQAATQADPTGSAPIVFTVAFSEPVVGFAPADVTLSGTAGANAVGIVGAGPVYTVTVDGMTQSGTVIVTIGAGVVTDAAGNPNAASTSVDNVVAYAPLAGPLTLNLPGAVTRNNDQGQAGAIVNYPAVTASGGVLPVSVVCAPASGTFFALGGATVTCVATDALSAQNQGDAIVTGTFAVTVVDVEPPVIADLPDLVRTTIGSTPVVATFPLPNASDNSGVAPLVTCSPQSSSSFAVGTTTVTCTATDGAGNSASSSFVVTVSSSGSGGIGLLPTTGRSVGTLMITALILLIAGLALQVPRRRASRR